jgi:hypothetical protein
MSETLGRVTALVGAGKVEVSLHGFRELASDAILLEDVLAGVASAIIVEDYPAAFKGPSVLVLQYDSGGHPIHVVWGIAKGMLSPAVLVTAYRPDPNRWTADFRERRS